MSRCRATGPADARLMIVGEAPGAEEVLKGVPFVGASGWCLDGLLRDAGLARERAFVTNVAREMPPRGEIAQWLPESKKGQAGLPVLRGRGVAPQIAQGFEDLAREIALVRPACILALGNTALWALTGEWGITDWRGSALLTTAPLPAGIPVIPTYHPAAILRMHTWKPVALQDMRRAKRALEAPPQPPAYRFELMPTIEQVDARLAHLLREAAQHGLKLAVDLETLAGHTACIGLAWSDRDALCIPFISSAREEGYWEEAQEVQIVRTLRTLLTHPGVEVVGQNFIYDAQYIHRHWGFLPRVVRDTMIWHHTLWAGAMPKGLDFLSSIYCAYHRYWKNEGKEWHTGGEDAREWEYNCKDAVITWEVDAALVRAAEQMGLREQAERQQEMFWPVFSAMRRGVRIAHERKTALSQELAREEATRWQWLERTLGHPLNPKSAPQMQALFYGDFAQRVVKNRKTGRPSLDDDALVTIAKREPLLRPLVQRIQEFRSLGVFRSTFVEARPSWDGRMRCSYNIAGTETFRLSSSHDAWGSGMNLQNVPKGSEDGQLSLPNIRRLFIPDEGREMFDTDLDRADLQVVVWEANDSDLKRALRLGLDMHCLNACSIFAIPGIPPEELAEGHPNYREHRARITEARRHKAKGGVHAVNYGCKARTLASALGCTVREAERFIDGWFGAHPGIKAWHERTALALTAKRAVANAFGYRRHYFDRPDEILPEALAWQPQSTVALVINRIWLHLYLHAPWIEVLMQVHDSLVGQYPIGRRAEAQAAIAAAASAASVPYPDPLTIPAGFKASTLSWGDVQ